MSSSNMPGIASSRYRQLRVTLTQELSGDCSYRVLAKGLNDAWSEQKVVAQGRYLHRDPIMSTEDAVAVLVDLLRQEMLPGIG